MKFRIVAPPVDEQTEVVVTARVFGAGDFDTIKLDQSKLGGAVIKSWSQGSNKNEFIFKLSSQSAKRWKVNDVVVLDLKQSR